MLALVLAVLIPTVAMPEHWNPAAEPQIAACFATLLDRAARSGYAIEHAAFVVLRDDDSFACVDWPATRHARADFVMYTGRIPHGTVAIAHTHPPALPLPSAQDAAEARRLDVPFVVLTKGRVEVARP